MNKPLNILLCAYACEPNKGSEPEVGWGTATVLAKKNPENNFFAITRKNNREQLEKYSVPKNLKFIFFELHPWVLKVKKAGNFTRIYYYLWMLGAVKFLKKGNVEFDIVHHITFVNDWLPSLFVKLKTKSNKFIWGSIGSHSKVPNKFLYGRKEKTIEFFRICLQKAFRALDPNFRKCVRQSDKIIGINNAVGKKLNVRKANYTTIPAIAITPLKDKTARKWHVKDKFVVLSVGRLIHIKNFKLTLNSFARFYSSLDAVSKKKTELIIVGSGSQKNELIKLSKKLKIFNNIQFIGYIPQQELMNLYVTSDVFLFPTAESAGFVILEAMSKELPVVALDYGGPGQFVKQNRDNQLVDPNLPIERIEEKMGELLLDLNNNIHLRKELGTSNKQTVFNEFTWEKKIEKFLEIYKNTVNESSV